MVPAQPGGGLDLIARTIGEQLGRQLEQSFVVENIAGAGGTVACQTVARAAPDGYTLMIGYVATHATAPAVRKVPYDAVRDFTPIAMVGGTRNMLVVHPSVPVADLKGFVAYAKGKAGGLKYGSGGIGTLNHLLMEQIEAMTPGLAAALPHLRSKRVKPIAVTGLARHALLPEVPTFEEAGFKGFDNVQWYGVVGPAKMQPDVVRRLNAEIGKALASAAFQQRLANEAIDPMPMTPRSSAPTSSPSSRAIARWSRSAVSASKSRAICYRLFSEVLTYPRHPLGCKRKAGTGEVVMRTPIAAGWIISIALTGALATETTFAQRRAATEAQARAYIQSAFITQADPGVMKGGVTLGPELQKQLGLPPEADGAGIYSALIALAGNQPVGVRGATPAEVAEYGARRGFDPRSGHALFTLLLGELRFLLQYDLQATNIPFVGRLGVADPDPRPVVAAKTEPVNVKAASAEPRKPALVNLVWTGQFEYNSATLTPEAQVRLDREILPKLMGPAGIRYLQLSGHTDRLGTPEYNQQLSEKRAEAVRAYLVAKGVDAEKIEVLGYGKTLPVKSCREEKRRELIECLAPNRRVVVEIQHSQ